MSRVSPELLENVLSTINGAFTAFILDTVFLNAHSILKFLASAVSTNEPRALSQFNPAQGRKNGGFHQPDFSLLHFFPPVHRSHFPV